MQFADPEIAGYVDAPGGRIWYRLNGGDGQRPPLVGIAGGPGMSHHCMLSLLRFSDRFPVVLYDQLDTGNADRPGKAENWHLERFVLELEQLRNALGYDRIIPVGHSWGGTVAVEYGLRFPQRVPAMLLISPYLSASKWKIDTGALVAGLPSYLREIIRACEERGDLDGEGYAHAKQEYGKLFLVRSDPWPPELQRSFSVFNRVLYRHMWGASEFNPSGTLKDYEALDRLRELPMPVLIAAGEHDEFRPATMREMARLFPDAKAVEIADASHFCYLEAADPFAAAAGEFLDSLARDGSGPKSTP